jgi:hypothetical protein
VARAAPEDDMTTWIIARRACVALIAAVALACARRAEVGSVPQQRQGGWHQLFDGRTLNGWRVYRSASAPTGWSVRDGMLTKSQPTEDIITTDQFGDFELELEWKVATGGNSGLFYRATEEYEKVYWSAPEYALLDDANARDGRNRITSAGAAHSLYAPPAGIVKPANEWNSTRVVARGGHVEHWLNGTKLFEFEQGSADWDARVKASKFATWANFGKARRGHIAIQGDHAGELWLRDIRIREIR